MQDLALDGDGDLALDSGRASLTRGPAAVLQRLTLRFKLWKGDWLLNRNLGIPYVDGIVGKNTKVLAESILRRAASTSPGVASIDSFQLTVGPDRRATVAFEGRTVDGEVLAGEAFRVGA